MRQLIVLGSSLSLLPIRVVASTPWQCQPGLVDLDGIYPELVSERSQSSRIGEGADGQIFLSHKSTIATAVKRFFPEHTTFSRIHHEYWIGHSLSHTNLARSHSLKHTQSKTGDVFWEIEMEFIDFPLLDLLDYDVWASRPWSFAEMSCMFTQVIDAVAHMHGQGIAHRDLKVENIMVTRDGTVKLIDFGSAAVSRNTLTGTRLNSSENWVGTPITMAPEVHREKFFDMEKADVWSLAVIAFRVLLGKYPWQPDGGIGGLANDENFLHFLEEKKNQMPCNPREGEPRILCCIPNEARTLLTGMLEMDPSRRTDLRRVIESLSNGHKFRGGNDRRGTRAFLRAEWEQVATMDIRSEIWGQ